ncbi:hypothetical protein H6278_001847 [Escherichia coli]|nr:hypothetical protein [Escherichia coli]MBB6939700.1 hypothetical protein [Escherichia coli]MBB9423135.1 hypothetical protein [Escherichia coli]MBB9427969.1 hypothetical protein [Escherichia coli]MCJ2760615.1 hypothetical protein [Escherichia coli]
MESNIKGLVSAGHEMASELKAECGAVDMRSVAKLLSDLATQLEVQLVRANALAVENAKLKKFCKDAAFDADYEAELGMERGGFSDALNEIKTPATDAFLAEVRAQGVEMMREHPSIKLCSLTHICDELAAQIRKGVQL